MSRRHLLLALVLGLPGTVLAGETPAVDAAQNLGRMLLGLGVVIAIVFALAWVARRASVLRFLGAAGGGPIAVVGQLSLGARERLLLVEVDGQRMLLGVVPGAITRLDTAAAGADAGADFAARLGTAQRSRS
ncbi:MAG: flagellar biosynthetic protein FliO [Haliea sp.]